MSERLPAIVLERYVLGELPAHERAAIDDRVRTDLVLAAAIDELRASTDEVLAALPPAEVAAEVARRDRLERAAARANARGRTVWLAGSALAAAAAVLLALVFVPRDAPRSGADRVAMVDDGDRAKGDPRLLVHAKRDGRVVELAAGASARAGDLLQLSYLAAGRAHGVVLSIDGAGAVTLHYPEERGGTTALRGGGAQRLPHAYQLDDAPGFERFFFLTAAHAIDVDDLLERAAALAQRPAEARVQSLSAPDGVSQVWFLVRKESSR